MEPALDRDYELIDRSGYRAPGFAEGYDESRPRPPAALLELLVRLVGIDVPGLVVDIGSGTGLSTTVWADRAREVVGVEPNPAMRRVAEARAPANVRYVDGFGHRTGLPESTADIVTCAQALHWMDVPATLDEVARVLRPGGVFAAYDYEWPPTVSREVELAFQPLLASGAFLSHAEAKGSHAERMRASGHFGVVKEIALHSLEEGDGARLVGLALTLGPVWRRLAEGSSERDLGIDSLRAAARELPGPVPWLFSYRVRLGLA